jgi:hypothetical protein
MTMSLTISAQMRTLKADFMPRFTDSMTVPCLKVVMASVSPVNGLHPRMIQCMIQSFNSAVFVLFLFAYPKNLGVSKQSWAKM